MAGDFRFKADKISGITGDLYFLSPVLEVVRIHNIRMRFRLRSLYGLGVDLEKSKSNEYIDEAGYIEESEKVLEEAKRHGLGYFEKASQTVKREADELQESVARLLPRLPSLSDDELLEAYDKFLFAYVWAYAPGAIAFVYESILSDRLARSLAGRYAEIAKIVQVALAQDYSSFMIESERALVDIRDAEDEERQKRLAQEYLGQFFFMKASYLGSPIATLESVLSDARKVESHVAAKFGTEAFESVSFTEEERTLIELLKITEVIHDQRKRTNLIGCYAMQIFLDEALRRTGFDERLARRIFWFEYRDLFFDAQALFEKLAQRRAASLVLSGANTFYCEGVCIEDRMAIGNGEETELRGTPASQGKKSGTARIVFGPADFDAFQPGEILIAEMTRPDFLPVIKKAAAIVTDEGGLTCHAAIVSRELGIPCLVGVKRGTKVFKNGDAIEVDAEKGMVRIINKV